MKKLLKYEFRRNEFGLLVITAVFVTAELLYLAGTQTSAEGLIGMSSFVLLWLISIAAFYVVAGGVRSLSRDLNEKSGYLIFMTPMSHAKILGAKIVKVLIESAVLYIGTVLVIVGNSWFSLSREKAVTMQEVYVYMKMNWTGYREKDDLWWSTVNIIVILFFVMIGLAMLVSIAYLSMSISAVLLQKVKYRKISGWAVFIAVSLLVLNIASRLYVGLDYMEDLMFKENMLAVLLSGFPLVLFLIAVSMAAYWAAVKLLDKGISL